MRAYPRCEALALRGVDERNRRRRKTVQLKSLSEKSQIATYSHAPTILPPLLDRPPNAWSMKSCLGLLDAVRSHQGAYG
jgi:hypothetical protein